MSEFCQRYILPAKILFVICQRYILLAKIFFVICRRYILSAKIFFVIFQRYILSAETLSVIFNGISCYSEHFLNNFFGNITFLMQIITCCYGLKAQWYYIAQGNALGYGSHTTISRWKRKSFTNFALSEICYITPCYSDC